jgi:triphosphatase
MARDGSLPSGVETKDLVLPHSIDAADAFRAMIDAGLDSLRAHQPAALAADIEGVHQMRVALRRLRTALVLFAPHLAPYAASPFNAALGALARILGEARDWDVFITETLPAAFADPAQDSWRTLLGARAAAAQAMAHDRLRLELGGPAPAGLMQSLAAWSHQPDLLHANACLADLAPALLDRLARKLRRRGRNAARCDSEGLHDLRKSLKKLRYAADFMVGVYPAKHVHAYLKRCRRLQALLGAINDAAAALALAERLAGDDVDLAAPTAHLGRWAAARQVTARRSLTKAVKRVADTAPFWQ